MRLPAIAVVAVVMLASCVAAPTGDSSVAATGEPPGEAVAAPVVDGPLRTISTGGGPTGNRFHEGAGSLPGTPMELQTGGPVAWVIAAETDEGLAVIAVDQQGVLAGFSLGEGSAEPIQLNLEALPAGTPPALVVGQGLLVLGPPVGNGSLDTSPLALASGGLAFVSDDGAVVVTQSTGNRRFELDPLPDARLILSSQGVLAALSAPTDRYPHGIAGDPLEAARVDLIDLAALQVVASVEIPDGRVVEGSAPLWADLDSDGTDELILTLSDASSGARLAVLSDDGAFVAESDPIGLGNRWRHQIAVGPFGPNGETELVDVRIPHIGGAVEFFTMANGRLGMTASLKTFSSHVIGSRNMDQALAADANGDGRPEVVVPHPAMTSLAGVQRTDDGAEEAWVFDLGERLSSNLAGVTTRDGRFVLVAGLADGRVLVWR